MMRGILGNYGMRKTAHFTNPRPDQQASGTPDDQIAPDLYLFWRLLAAKHFPTVN